MRRDGFYVDLDLASASRVVRRAAGRAGAVSSRSGRVVNRYERARQLRHAAIAAWALAGGVLFAVFLWTCWS